MSSRAKKKADRRYKPAPPVEWARLPALEGKPNPCLHCPPILPTIGMDRVIAVGFGAAYVSRDGESLYDEAEVEDSGKEHWEVRDAERLATKDPEHDWRIVMHGPMHGETYQRQGPGSWVLVEKNEGFA